MPRSRIAAVALASALLATACAGGPAPEPGPAPGPAQAGPGPAPIAGPKAVEPSGAPQPAFNPASVSAEVKSATMVDIKTYVEELNGLIRKKDFDGWKSRLTDQYMARYSDPEVLAGPSKTLGRTLSSLYDYFVYVVYPSRQYDRVDDIDFVSENEVTAYTVNPKGEKLVLYSLERIGGTWKIGIGRQ